MKAPKKRAVLAATVLGSSLAFIDGSVVNVALPAIQGSLRAGTGGMQWIVNGYMLLLGALVLIGGAAGDRYGRRRVFLIGIVVFTVASVLCAVAPSIAMLIGARALQGLGAAMLVPCSLAILGASFSANERGGAVGTWAGFGALTVALGPVLGGWLVDTISWRAIFFLNVPLAAIAIGLTLHSVPESRDPQVQRIDWPGALFAVLGLFALSFGLTDASERGLGDARALTIMGAGALLLGAFVAVELNSKAPMVAPQLFRSPDFSGANLLTLLLYFALSGALFFVPFELIRLHGYSATAAGAALLPFSVILGVFSRTAGKLADRWGPRLPLTIGPFITGVGFAAMSLPVPGQSYWTGFGPAAVIVGLGMTLAVAPLTSTVIAAVPAGHQGIASGVNNAVARVAGLLAVAMMTVVFAQVFASKSGMASVAQAQSTLVKALSGSGDVPRASHEAFHAAFRMVMLIAAICAAVGGVVAGFMVRGRRGS